MSEEQERSAEQTAHHVLVTPQRRRRPRRQKHVYSRPIHWPRTLLLLGFVAALLIGGARLTERNTARHAVALKGTVLVVLDSNEEAYSAIQALRRKYVSDAPSAVSFAEGNPVVRAYRGKMASHGLAKAVDTLDRHLTILVDGYAIYVNGKPQVILATEERAWQAIALAQQRGLAGREGVPTFKERVRIRREQYTEGRTDGLPLLSARQAAAFLVHPPRANIYSVNKGDSFWTIANAHGITVQQLKDLNPTVDHTRLDVGDTVKLPDQPSPITVVVRQ